MTVTLQSRKDFNLKTYRRVALDGDSVRIGSKAIRTMKATRKSFMALLESDRTQFIYGTTSGGGPMAKIPIPPKEQRRRANEMGRRRHGSGFGGGLAPDRVVRGMIFARLANFIEGNAKTRPVVAQRIASMLDRALPEVPLSGQVGAGEILPLAHVLSTLPQGRLQEAEPMALVNGSPCSAALVADVGVQARNRLELAERVFCLSIEAINAPLAAYDPALARLWGDPDEQEAVRAINRWLRGCSIKDRRFYQAPVSWRVLPRLLGVARKAVGLIEEVAETSLASVTDNPVYMPPSAKHKHGRVFSTGGYHNGMGYAAIDTVNAAWADLCTLADHHTTKMHNGAVSQLPDMLLWPGQSGFSGTAGLGFVQIGFGEEAKHAAQRTLLPSSEGGGYAQNDVASPTFLAYQKNEKAHECIDSSLAILAVVASQALMVAKRGVAPPLRGFLRQVRSHVPVFGPDQAGRNKGEELAGLRDAFADMALSGKMPAG